MACSTFPHHLHLDAVAVPKTTTDPDIEGDLSYGLSWVVQCLGHEERLIDCTRSDSKQLTQKCTSLAGIKCGNKRGLLVNMFCHSQ